MTKIVFFGDSVTYGVRTGVAAADTFAQKIGTARGFTTIVNAGVPGNSSSNGLARYAADVLAQSPDAVCIMFGINDVYLNTPVATFKSNLLSMVQQAKTAGIRPTLLTPNMVGSTPYLQAFPPYLDAIRQVAHDESIPMADCYMRFADLFFLYDKPVFDALWVDYQHPSANGHQAITDWVLMPYNASACS